MAPQIDPMLALILGDDGSSDTSGIGPETELHPVEYVRFEAQYGIPHPAANRPRSIEEIEKALENIRAELAIAPTEQKREFYRLMAKASEEHCESTSFTYRFLHAAANGDTDGMRAAARDLAREKPSMFAVN